MAGQVPVQIARVPFLVPSWAAAQVPRKRTIWVRKDVSLSERLLAHELCHVAQAERHPWPTAYFAQWALTGFSYRDMPFEVEARAAENEPFYRAWARELLASQSIAAPVRP
jgi:hypothetical protein